MHEKNRTRFKTLDRIAADKRCEKIYQDSDGIWVDLAPGYNFEECSGLRGDTVAEVHDKWRLVEDGGVPLV
jgi:hypothetical protein